MKRIRIQTVEDLESVPEGEWFFVPDGTPVTHSFEGFEVKGGKLRIKIPREVVRQFGAIKGRQLRAKLRGNDLVVEK